jgi:hypothetical protein
MRQARAVDAQSLQMEEEHALTESLLLSHFSSEYPFAVAAEWEFVPGLTNLGRGDLVFASKPVKYNVEHEPCRVLVVEVKHLTTASGKTGRSRRTIMRKKVEAQMRQAMDAWSQRHPQDEVFGAVYTNDDPGSMSDNLPGVRRVGALVGTGYLSASISALSPSTDVLLPSSSGAPPCPRIETPLVSLPSTALPPPLPFPFHSPPLSLFEQNCL